MAFLFFLSSRSHMGAAVLLDSQGSVQWPGSERHHAQDLTFELRVDPAGYGICDRFEVHPGARLNDGADDAHEEAWVVLTGGGQGAGDGMSDKRHGWSPLRVWTTQDVSCFFGLQ